MSQKGWIGLSLACMSILLALTWSAEAGTKYHFQNLGHTPVAINDSSIVVDFFGNIWDPATHTWTSMGNLGHTYVEAYAINSKGEVVGAARTADLKMHVFLYDPVARRMYDRGIGFGYGINNLGAIVGYSSAINGSTDSGAFILKNGIMQKIGTGHARDINDAEQIVGYDFTTGACFWPNASVPAQALLDGDEAYKINKNGQIAGKGGVDACLWNSAAAQPIYLTGSVPYGGYANCLNDTGQVVGTYIYEYVTPPFSVPMPVYHAFVWTPQRGFEDLNALVPNMPAGTVLTEATGINNHGQIVVADGYLLTPIVAQPAVNMLLLD
jgi:probable HAF family extracellular repeat protein